MISYRDIRSSALKRFLPGWVGALTLLPALVAPKTFRELQPTQFVLIAAYTLAALVGHALTLAILRSRLRGDSALTGSKSVVIGACSVFAIVITSMLPHGRRDYVDVALIYASVSAVLTVAMYAPWIRRRSAPDDSGRVDLLWVRAKAFQEFQ